MQKQFKNDQWVGVSAYSKKDGAFTIPVMDARRERQRVANTIKSVNSSKGSSFMKPSFSVAGHSYQVSRKTK